MRKPLRPESKGQLLLHLSVVEFIEKEAGKAVVTETGGVLAGTGAITGGTVHVTHASAPGSRAKKSLLSFARDTTYCQRFLDRLATESCGEIDYLGEWHKHHEDAPRPSFRDILTATEIANSDDYHVDVCLLIVIGRSNRRDSLRSFIVDQDGDCLRVPWELCEE